MYGKHPQQEMGLGNLIDDDINTEEQTSSGHPLQRYGGHEKDEQLQEAIDELAGRFPIHPQIEFIEVSPRMSKTPARLYTKERDGEEVKYIRVSESFTNRTESDIRQSLLYLLVQAYFKELGFEDISPANDEFKWVCGQVGAPTNPIDTRGDAWRLACAPMLEEDDVLTERHPDAFLDQFIEGEYFIEPRHSDKGNEGEVPPPEDEV